MQDIVCRILYSKCKWAFSIIYQCKYVLLLSDNSKMLPVEVLHQFYNPWCNTAVRGNRAQESGKVFLI